MQKRKSCSNENQAKNKKTKKEVGTCKNREQKRNNQ